MKTLIISSSSGLYSTDLGVKIRLLEGDKVITEQTIPLPPQVTQKTKSDDLFTFWLIQLEQKLARQYNLGQKKKDYLVKYSS